MRSTISWTVLVTVGVFPDTARHVHAAPASGPARPNVVIFLTDDQGWADLGVHGNPHVKTPNLDAFARSSVELARFHVNPVCAPTRASIITGRYNFRTGVADVFGAASRMDPAEVTLAEVLREAGYATGIFGKWHLGDDGPHAPNAQGFDESLVFRGAAMRAEQYFNPELLHNGRARRCSGYCMDVFTTAAIEFVQQNHSRPFFLYLPANLIHTPLQVADEFAAPFKAASLDGKTARICGMVHSVDAIFARLRRALQDLGLEQNTLVIFTSDNGPCSGGWGPSRHMGPLHGLKGTVYENGIRVPCFVRWPAGLRRPATVDRLAAHIDLLPTILDACSIPAPAGVNLDGISLLPLLKDPGAPWAERTLFFQWDSGQVPRRGYAFAALTDRWKLVQPVGMDARHQKHIRDRYSELCRLQGRGDRTIEGQPRHELYAIATDSEELHDVAGDHPEIVERMKRQYQAWFDDVAARWQRGQN